MRLVLEMGLFDTSFDDQVVSTQGSQQVERYNLSVLFLLLLLLLLRQIVMLLQLVQAMAYEEDVRKKEQD
jgi:hypothetical protein